MTPEERAERPAADFHDQYVVRRVAVYRLYLAYGTLPDLPRIVESLKAAGLDVVASGIEGGDRGRYTLTAEREEL